MVALPHALDLINSYLFGNGSHWTLEAASNAGFVCLLDCIKKHEWSGLDHSFREKRFDFAIEVAARNGRIEVLEWWLTIYMPERTQQAIPCIIQEACACDRLDVLQWLHEQGKYGMLHRRVKVSCRSPEVADWVFAHLRFMTTAEYSLDFRSNDGFTMFKLACRRGVHCPFICLYNVIADKAAADGNLEALKWMHERYIYRCSSVALNAAVNHDQLHVVQWLYDNYPRGYFDKLTYGCDENDTFEWVLSNYEWIDLEEKKTWIARCMSRARRWWTQKLDVLERLVLARPDADKGNAMEAAAKRGDLQIVQRLHACGAKVTPKAMNSAASKGHLSVLRWLHEFREEGCTNEAVKYATLSGHLEVIQWLHQHKPECFTTDAMDFAAYGGHIEIVKWLHFNRTEGCTTLAMDLAATNGHAKVVEWLHDNRTEGCSANAIARAAERGSLGIVKFLYRNYPDFESMEKATYTAGLYGRLKVVQYFTVHHQICLDPSEISNITGSRRFAEAEWLLRDTAQRVLSIFSS